MRRLLLLHGLCSIVEKGYIEQADETKLTNVERQMLEAKCLADAKCSLRFKIEFQQLCFQGLYKTPQQRMHGRFGNKSSKVIARYLLLNFRTYEENLKF